MTIAALPTPPNRANSPAEFSNQADALLGALPGFVTQANALSDDVNAKQATATAAAATATTKADEASASALATAADRVQTGLDKAATAADRVQTGLDRAATAADRVQTGLDRVQTGLDKDATAADRVQTGLDRTQTGLDKVATAADRVQTGLDKVATAADRVQTGLDVTASSASAAAAAASEATALGYKNTAVDRANSAAGSAQSAIDTLLQTQYARDQALAGLGAADNSQILVELGGQDSYALDIAGQAVRELAGVPTGVDRIAAFMAQPMDLVGVAARTLAACLKTVGVPANASSYGQKGDVAVDANYIYVCTAANTWKRVAIATW